MDRVVSPAVIDEPGGQDAAVTNFYVALVQLFVNDGETVALANVEREVDVPAEDGDRSMMTSSGMSALAAASNSELSITPSRYTG